MKRPKDKKPPKASNPWLEIPLADYEAHMSLSSVAQAPYLAWTLGRWVTSLEPSSVAVLGCAGGNGFEALPPSVVRRVVGVDLNGAYLAAAGERHRGRFETVELINSDILSPACVFTPVDFVFAALIFEYVNPEQCLRKIRGFLNPGGRVGVVLQGESPGHTRVTSSSFPSLKRLEGWMRLVPPGEFKHLASAGGFLLLTERKETLETGKSFSELLLTLR